MFLIIVIREGSSHALRLSLINPLWKEKSNKHFRSFGFSPSYKYEEWEKGKDSVFTSEKCRGNKRRRFDQTITGCDCLSLFFNFEIKEKKKSFWLFFLIKAALALASSLNLMVAQSFCCWMNHFFFFSSFILLLSGPWLSFSF